MYDLNSNDLLQMNSERERLSQSASTSKDEQNNDYCLLFNAREHHIQLTPTIVPPIDVEKNRLSDEAKSCCGAYI